MGLSLLGLLSFLILRRRKKPSDSDSPSEKFGGTGKKPQTPDDTPHPDDDTRHSGFAFKAELPGSPLDPVEMDSTVGTAGSPSMGSGSPMGSPMYSEFSGGGRPVSSVVGQRGSVAGRPGSEVVVGGDVRERWERSEDAIRPIYELE